ncbi:MAG TPA: CHAT domain-containing tetratricopeptide repeat protein [Thermoanaerobaculia bacterium]
MAKVLFGVMLMMVATAAAPAQLDSAIASAQQLATSGNAAAAITAYRRLLPQTTGVTRARVLDALAVLEIDGGDYKRATRDANAAAVLFAASGHLTEQANALNHVGLAALYAGDYERAARTLNVAIPLSTASKNYSGLAEQVTNLANVDFFLGHYADAAANYDRALQITDAHAAEAWTARRRHLILVNKATLDQRLGRDREALAVYRQIQAGTTNLPPNEQAQVLMNLGVLYRHLGDPIKALQTYDQALGLFSLQHSTEGELAVMRNRGIVLALDLRQLDAARQTFSDALDRATKAKNGRQMLQAQLYRGETELRAGTIEPARADFQASLDAARSLRTPEEEWKALYGLARTELRQNDAASSRIHLQQAVDVIEKIREGIKVPTLRSDFFNDKRDVYDLLISLELQQADVQRVFDLVERSHSRAWRDLLGLTAPITVSQVQRALPAGALLIDAWSSPVGSALISITRSSADVKQVAVDEAEVRKLADDLQAGPSPDWQSVASRIGEKLLRPLPPETQHVIVVPDGPLSVIPFELLPVSGRPLVQQAAVSYLPTAAMLVRRAPAQERLALPWTNQLRAFADPVFASARLDDPNQLRTQLAASAGEAKGIASEVGGRSVLHLGTDDRKAYLYATDARAPLLHIATHAFADENALEQSRMLFSPDKGSSSAEYLFLKEAYALPLQHVELAVLSACDTERGRVVRGEGVQSFSRAFLASGARSTVTTLWRVPDQPTAAFMKVFYHHLQRGESRAEALRQAKLKFLRSGSQLSNPHYWAAFVLTGEGLQPIPRAIRWRSIVLIAIAILGVAALWIAAARRRRPVA